MDSLKKEIVKLAKARPELRKHLLPLLKQAASKILLGELKQAPDGSWLMQVNLRGGGNAAQIFKKFQMAAGQRKLVVNFTDTGITFMIPKTADSMEDNFPVV
jgi:hypothetical protein